MSAGAGASVGGNNGIGAGAGAGVGGSNGIGAGAGASVGGRSGVSAGLGAGIGGTNGSNGSNGVNVGLGATLGGTSGLSTGAGATVGELGGLGAGLGITVGNPGLGDLPGLGSVIDPGVGATSPTNGTGNTASRTRTSRRRGVEPVDENAMSQTLIDSLNAAPYNPYTDESRYVGYDASYDDGQQGTFMDVGSRSLVEQRRCTTRVCLRRLGRTHR